jgi:hypothetical protein
VLLHSTTEDVRHLLDGTHTAQVMKAAKEQNCLPFCGFPRVIWVGEIGFNPNTRIRHFVVGSTGEYWDIEWLGKTWSSKVARERRLKLLKQFGTAQNQPFIHDVQDDRDRAKRHFAARGKTNDRWALQQWLRERHSRAQTNLRWRGAAFSIGQDGLDYKARCAVCEATMHYTMPKGAWHAEEKARLDINWEHRTVGSNRLAMRSSDLSCAEVIGFIHGKAVEQSFGVWDVYNGKDNSELDEQDMKYEKQIKEDEDKDQRRGKKKKMEARNGKQGS